MSIFNLSFILNLFAPAKSNISKTSGLYIDPSYYQKQSFLERNFVNHLFLADMDVVDLIKRAKLGGEWSIAFELGRILANKWKSKTDNAGKLVVIPVPGDPVRLIERDYHVPNLLGSEFARVKKCQLIDIFKKVRHTPTQTSLKRDERLKNLVDAFKVDKDKFNELLMKIQNNDELEIIILDDVSTTGATLNILKNLLQSTMIKHHILFNKTKKIKISLLAVVG